MRKLAVLVVVVALTLLAMKPLLGVAPLAIHRAPLMAAGLAAKLACSHHYLSGLASPQIQSDLESYSPGMKLIDLEFDPSGRRVSASLAGIATLSASYRRGLGCSLDIGDTSALDTLQISPPERQPETPWPAGDRVDSVDDSLQQALAALLAADDREGYQTRALLMVREGKVVAEAYAPGFGAEVPLLGWSMAKSLTAMLIGNLEYQGLVATAERSLFPGWDSDARADITVENLLQMSSGLQFDEEYAPGSDATRMLFTSYSASEVALASPLVHPPGQHFAYSSGTTNLLARLLVERLGGTRQALQFLWYRFLLPQGMRDTVVEMDPSGVFVGSSYVYASARDWARLGQTLLNGGILNGQRLLSRDWVRRATSPGTAINEPRYGYQIWLNRGGEEPRWPGLPADAFAMMGNRSQVVMAIPSASVVLVRLGWSDREYPTAEKFAALLAAAARSDS